jgi:hypothetical protein
MRHSALREDETRMCIPPASIRVATAPHVNLHPHIRNSIQIDPRTYPEIDLTAKRSLSSIVRADKAILRH